MRATIVALLFCMLSGCAFELGKVKKQHRKHKRSKAPASRHYTAPVKKSIPSPTPPPTREALNQQIQLRNQEIQADIQKQREILAQ